MKGHTRKYQTCKLQILLTIISVSVQVSSFSFCHSKRIPLISFIDQHYHPQHSSIHQTRTKTELWSRSDDDDDEDDDDFEMKPSSCNVLGTPLKPCCTDVGGSGIGTGFYRNGYCSTGDQDLGRHTVCIRATEDFLAYSSSVGNDLSTPAPEYMFPGLKEGDIWCLCAQRWAQAFNDRKAPMLYLQATHEKTLSYIPLEILMKYAIDKDEADNVLNNLNEQRAKLDRLL